MNFDSGAERLRGRDVLTPVITFLPTGLAAEQIYFEFNADLCF